MKVLLTLLVIMALALPALIVFGVANRPTPLPAVAYAIEHTDRTGLPTALRFRARDGAELAYRYYPAGETQVAVLIHGSAGQGIGMHALATHLAKQGVSVYVPDIRGHGDSGSRRGDIDYLGQLDDDMRDFVAAIRPAHPQARYTLAGFSAGGAFTARTAANADLFDRYVALAPAFVFPGGIARRGNGGWANASMPRTAGLVILNHVGIHAFDYLPTLFFAAPRDNPFFTNTYSHRLTINFSASPNYEWTLRRMRKPLTIIVGADDDQFDANAYEPRIKPIKPDVTVEILPGVKHVGSMLTPQVHEAVARLF